MKKALYTTEIQNLVSVYVIDGECVKNRDGYKTITPEEIQERKVNFENISIQKGRNIEVYCSEQIFEYIKDLVENDNMGHIKKILKNGSLEVFSKDSKLDKNTILN